MIHCMRVKNDREGVAVSRSLSDKCGPDGARRTALVFNDDGLPQLGLQRLRQDARNLIYGASRWKHGDQLDRLFAGPGLR